MKSPQININLFKFFFYRDYRFVSTQNSSLFLFYVRFIYIVKIRVVDLGRFNCYFMLHFKSNISTGKVVVGEIEIVKRFF